MENHGSTERVDLNPHPQPKLESLVSNGPASPSGHNSPVSSTMAPKPEEPEMEGGAGAAFPSHLVAEVKGTRPPAHQYYGVYYLESNNTYRTKLRDDICGYFKTAEQGARARDRLVICKYGLDKCEKKLNFPLSDYAHELEALLNRKYKDLLKEVRAEAIESKAPAPGAVVRRRTARKRPFAKVKVEEEEEDDSDWDLEHGDREYTWTDKRRAKAKDGRSGPPPKVRVLHDASTFPLPSHLGAALHPPTYHDPTALPTPSPRQIDSQAPLLPGSPPATRVSNATGLAFAAPPHGAPIFLQAPPAAQVAPQPSLHLLTQQGGLHSTPSFAPPPFAALPSFAPSAAPQEAAPYRPVGYDQAQQPLQVTLMSLQQQPQGGYAFAPTLQGNYVSGQLHLAPSQGGGMVQLQGAGFLQPSYGGGQGGGSGLAAAAPLQLVQQSYAPAPVPPSGAQIYYASAPESMWIPQTQPSYGLPHHAPQSSHAQPQQGGAGYLTLSLAMAPPLLGGLVAVQPASGQGGPQSQPGVACEPMGQPAQFGPSPVQVQGAYAASDPSFGPAQGQFVAQQAPFQTVPVQSVQYV